MCIAYYLWVRSMHHLRTSSWIFTSCCQCLVLFIAAKCSGKKTKVYWETFCFSPVNSECCQDCGIAPAKTPCFGESEISCKNASYCTYPLLHKSGCQRKVKERSMNMHPSLLRNRFCVLLVNNFYISVFVDTGTACFCLQPFSWFNRNLSVFSVCVTDASWIHRCAKTTKSTNKETNY